MGERVLRLFQGLGLRVAISLVERDRVDVVITGVIFGVSRQVAQALAQERKAHAAELAARGAVAPAELEAARAGEREARELLAAAEARAARLEAELAEEHRRQDELFEEAIKVGAATATADVEIIADDGYTWRGPVGQA